MPDLSPATCLLVLLALLAAGPAWSQAGGNRSALESLGPKHTRPLHARHGSARHAARPAPPAAAGALPRIPAAPPPPPVIKAPVVDVPLHPFPPPPPVPVVANAPGQARTIAGGTRITFGPGSADLNDATMQALDDLARRMRADPAARAQIDAYARGTADDPSTPRRMSLARGLAARAVLINHGIASTRIYVRAIGQPRPGSASHDTTPDRVDLALSDSRPTTPGTP